LEGSRPALFAGLASRLRPGQQVAAWPAGCRPGQQVAGLARLRLQPLDLAKLRVISLFSNTVLCYTPQDSQKNNSKSAKESIPPKCF
jgi:hypothetical protein